MASIIQKIGYSSGAGSVSSASFTLASTPIVGNILIAAMSFYTGVDPVLTPSGWTLIQNNEDDTTAGVVCFSRVVQAGDGKTWTLTFLTGSDSVGAALYEISGQTSVGVINQKSNSHNSSSATSLATATVTPSVLNCLALAFESSDSGSGTASVGAGWTKDFDENPSFHAFHCASRNSLTSDTSTGINVTFSSLGNSVQVAIIILIAPFVVGKLYSYNQAVKRASTY